LVWLARSSVSAYEQKKGRGPPLPSPRRGGDRTGAKRGYLLAGPLYRNTIVPVQIFSLSNLVVSVSGSLLLWECFRWRHEPLWARSRREYMGVFRSKGSPSVGSPADFASQRWFRGAFKAPYGVVSLPSVPAGQCLGLWASLSMRCTVLCDHSVPISGGCVTGRVYHMKSQGFHGLLLGAASLSSGMSRCGVLSSNMTEAVSISLLRSSRYFLSS